MKEIFRVVPGLPNSTCSLEVDLNDTALISLSTEDLYNAFFKIGQNKPIYIKLTIDNEYNFGEYNSFFRKIEEATAGNVKIDIYTSGRNFDQIMSYIGTKGSDIDYTVYIDDHDIREILDSRSFNLSNVVCPCYLSRRYIRNLGDSDFNSICNSNLFVFDREEALMERQIIHDVWQEIIPSKELINKLTQHSKMILVADYINENICYAYGAARLAGQVDGRNYYNVEDWAQVGIDTYQHKSGVCSGQSDLASILLDNYYAKTNCRIVGGLHCPARDPHAWITLCTEDGNYGICLTMPKRFVDLSKRGYNDGKINLELIHSNREDYEIDIDSYINISQEDYNAFKSKIYRILEEEQNKDRVVPLSLPRQREVLPPPLPIKPAVSKQNELLPPPLPIKSLNSLSLPPALPKQKKLLPPPLPQRR